MDNVSAKIGFGDTFGQMLWQLSVTLAQPENGKQGLSQTESTGEERAMLLGILKHKSPWFGRSGWIYAPYIPRTPTHTHPTPGQEGIQL